MTSADDILNDRDRAARLDAFAEQAKQALTQAIAERDKAYDRIVELLAQHCSNATLIKELKNLTAQLQADKAELLEGLKKIADPKSDCGCVPCTGQCASRESLEIKLDAIRDFAEALITKHSGAGETG